MTMIESTVCRLRERVSDVEVDDAQLAEASFLARYRGRTLEAYRRAWRGFFQWATDTGVDVMSATRPHIELFRGWMEERGLAGSTINRSTASCGTEYQGTVQRMTTR